MKQKQISIKGNAPELFTLANSLRKEGLTQKEAFASARETLTKKALREHLTNLMDTSVVTITFTNRKGKTEAAKATNNPSEIPSRKIGGRKTAKNEEWLTFYDKIHGMYRSITLNSVVEFGEGQHQRSASSK